MDSQTLENAPRVEPERPASDDLVFWWSPEIEHLRREGRLTEALLLAWAAMEAVKDVRPLPYGWAWGVAVIARQMLWYDLEIEVIERVLAIAAQEGTSAEQWESRMSTATVLRVAEIPALVTTTPAPDVV